MTRHPKNDKWTKLELDNIPASWDGDTLADGGGLRGKVTLLKSGLISIKWRYDFRYANKLCGIICGTYPAKSMAEIRITRDEARRLVSEGIDPRAKKVADKIQAQATIAETIAKAQLEKKQTVADLFDDWVKHGVKRINNNKAIFQSFDKHILPKIGQTPIKALDDRALLLMFRDIADSGKQRTAEMLYNDLKQMILWAELRKPWRNLLVEGNPIKLISTKDFLTNYVRERDRVLSEDELKELSKASKKLKPETRLALLICLGTLCRIGELLKAEWKHVDIDKREWFIPAGNSKKVNGVQSNHIIYLSDFTLNIFKELRLKTGNSQWLFPSKNKDDKHVDEKTVSKQIGDRQFKFKSRKVLSGRVSNNDLVIGDRDWTPHDLRRTGATMMQALKIPLDVIDRCQHHKMSGKVRRHYMHHEYKDEMKDAWEKLGENLIKIFNN